MPDVINESLETKLLKKQIQERCTAMLETDDEFLAFTERRTALAIATECYDRAVFKACEKHRLDAFKDYISVDTDFYEDVFKEFCTDFDMIITEIKKYQKGKNIYQKIYEDITKGKNVDIIPNFSGVPTIYHVMREKSSHKDNAFRETGTVPSHIVRRLKGKLYAKLITQYVLGGKFAEICDKGTMITTNSARNRGEFTTDEAAAYTDVCRKIYTLVKKDFIPLPYDGRLLDSKSDN